MKISKHLNGIYCFQNHKLFWIKSPNFLAAESRVYLEHSVTNYTGKNDLLRQVTHREAVFGVVIHSIISMWHYEVLWTCE